MMKMPHPHIKIASPHISRPPRLPHGAGRTAFPAGGVHAFRGALTPAQPDRAFATMVAQPQQGDAAPAMPEG